MENDDLLHYLQNIGHNFRKAYAYAYARISWLSSKRDGTLFG